MIRFTLAETASKNDVKTAMGAVRAMKAPGTHLRLAAGGAATRKTLHAKKGIRMKTLIAVLAMVGALTAWAPTIHAQQYPADNSGKNVRDRKDGAPTSGDQSNAKSDVAITQEIRKAVMADKSLSTNAHNVKIITADGVVTLRGPVKSAAEKATIGAKAKQAAGVTRVDNQLEIASN